MTEHEERSPRVAFLYNFLRCQLRTPGVCRSIDPPARNTCMIGGVRTQQSTSRPSCQVLLQHLCPLRRAQDTCRHRRRRLLRRCHQSRVWTCLFGVLDRLFSPGLGAPHLDRLHRRSARAPARLVRRAKLRRRAVRYRRVISDSRSGVTDSGGNLKSCFSDRRSSAADLFRLVFLFYLIPAAISTIYGDYLLAR